MISQSRLASFIESCANVMIGYWVAIIAQVILFPLFGIHGIGFGKNLAIGAAFTLVSLVRSYCIRRLFNHLHQKKHLT
jgi:hypothetical protein